MKLTTKMAGKTIHSVWRCRNVLELRFTDGTSLKVGWRDDMGELINGEPDMLFEGTHVRAVPVMIRRTEDGHVVDH